VLDFTDTKRPATSTAIGRIVAGIIAAAGVNKNDATSGKCARQRTSSA
jgi:hypothetical protein